MIVDEMYFCCSYNCVLFKPQLHVNICAPLHLYTFHGGGSDNYINTTSLQLVIKLDHLSTRLMMSLHLIVFEQTRYTFDLTKPHSLHGDAAQEGRINF